MRKMLFPSALSLMLGFTGLAFGQAADTKSDKSAAESSGKEVTGVVQEVDKPSGEIVVDGQSFYLEGGGGAALVPATGDEVTLFYEEQGDRKVVTRIGQKQ